MSLYFDLMADSSLALHWPLNDTISPFQPVDVSGNRRHSTASRTPYASVAGPTDWLRRGLGRTGTNSNQQHTINALAFDPATQQFTMAFWIKRLADGVNESVLQVSSADASTGVRAAVRANNDIGFNVSGAGNYGIPLELNKWHHVAITWDMAVLAGYRDGAAVSSTGTSALAARPFTNVFWFGGTDALSALNQQFSQFLFYHRALQASEVAAIHQGPSGSRGFPLSRMVN